MDAAVRWFENPTVRHLLQVAFGLVVVAMLVRLTSRSLGRLVKDSGSRYRARKGVTFLGYVLGLLVVVAVYGGRLSGFGVTIGVAGAGIAFALQEVIASVAGWFAISFSSFYSIGDRVQLGGIRGDVIDIGVLRTTIMEMGEWVKGDLYTGRVVRVANSFVFKEPVYNYSGDFPFLWDEIQLPVRYGCDWNATREMLARIADEELADFSAGAKRAWGRITRTYMVEDAIVDPMVAMVLTDNWIEFTVRYVVDFKSRRATKNRLFRRILTEVEASNGRIMIASATVELVDPSTLIVRSAEGAGPLAP